MMFNSGLAIMPTRNMINNVGISADSTHFSGSAHSQPRALRRIYTKKRNETTFLLKHPHYVIENVGHIKNVYRILGWRHPTDVTRNCSHLSNLCASRYHNKANKANCGNISDIFEYFSIVILSQFMYELLPQYIKIT